MKQSTKNKLINSINIAQTRLDGVKSQIEHYDIEAGYRILTSIHNDLWKVRLRLFKKLHPAVKLSVPSL